MLSLLKQKRNDLPIRTRLRILVVSLIILIGVLCFYCINGILRINDKEKQLYEIYTSSVVNVSSFTEKLYSVVIENHILISRNQQNGNLLRIKAIDSELIQKYISDYEENIKTVHENELFSNFVSEMQNYVNINKEIIALYRNNQDSVANVVRTSKEVASFRRIQTILHQIMQASIDKFEEAKTGLNDYQQSTINDIYLIAAIFLLLGLFTSYFFVNDLIDSIEKLKYNLSVLGNGEIPAEKVLINQNDIGIMSAISNRLSDNLLKIRDFAKEIGQGNYNYDFEALGNQDVIGNSLLNLRDNLKIAKKDEERRKVEDEQRNWTTKGLAMFGEILRQSSGNINNLADEIIKNIVYYLKANQGGLFIYNDNNKEDVYLELLAAFAYDRKKYFTKQIHIGEGLIGTCALEKHTIYMTEIPEDYIEIESGLGDATPRSLLITPLKTESGILGIVEIASFNELAKYEIEFVENLTESIASTLSTARINARTYELLAESQKKSEELAIREEEMRQNMEDMRKTQEEALRSKAEMSSILTAIDQTLLKSEHDVDGKFLSANLRFLSTFAYHLDELQLKNIHTLVPTDYGVEFRTVWENLRNGHPHKITIRHKSKNGKAIWLLSQYTPILSEVGKVVKILHLASDITEQKLIEEETKNQSLILINQETELKNNFEALKDSQEEIARKNSEITEKVYFFEQLLDAVSFPIIVTDLDENYTFVNKAVEDIFESKREELMGLPSNKEVILHQPGRVFKEDTFYTYDTKFNQAGHIDIFQDITDQKIAEENNKKLFAEAEEKAKQLSAQDEEMRQSLEQLLVVQEQMEKKEIEMSCLLSAIDHILMKAEYNIDGTILDANQLFLDTLAYDLSEIVGKNIETIAPDDSKEELRKIWTNVLKGNVYQGIVKRRSKTNRNIWIILSYTPIKNYDGTITKVLSLASDITREKELESKAQNNNDEIVEKEKQMKQTLQQISEIEAEVNKKMAELKQKENITKNSFENEVDKIYFQWLKSL